VALRAELLDHVDRRPHPRQRGVGPRAGELEVGRAQAQDHPAVERRQRRAGRQRDAMAGERHRAPADVRLDEVHRGRADERGDEQVHRAVEQLLGPGALLQDAVAQDGDARAQRHRLDLVVGDVHRRDPEAVVELRELRAHRHAELRVEVRQRLVHEEGGRLADDRAAHRDGLALAARERVTSRSPISTVPAVVSSIPAMSRSSVDLPQPDGPTRTVNSP
jgi:hypothetical protein